MMCASIDWWTIGLSVQGYTLPPTGRAENNFWATAMICFLGFRWSKRDEYEDYYMHDPNEDTSPNWPPRPRRRSGPNFLAHFLVQIVCIGLLLGLCWVLLGSFVTLKLVKALVSPIGLVWIVLFMAGYALTLLRQGAVSLIAWSAWFALSVSGNSYVANWAVRTLETPLAVVDPLEEQEFAAVIVLGGGTKMSLNDNAQVSGSGDRVVLAARMYHAGLTSKILCTGNNWRPLVEGELDLGPQARDVLIGLGVPAERIELLGGRNTWEEMESIQQWLEKSPDAQRVGLISSAWHLPRAQRIAEQKVQQTLISLPADFAAVPYVPGPHLLIPSSDCMSVTTQVLHEHLGRFIGQ